MLSSHLPSVQLAAHVIHSAYFVEVEVLQQLDHPSDVFVCAMGQIDQDFGDLPFWSHVNLVAADLVAATGYVIGIEEVQKLVDQTLANALVDVLGVDICVDTGGKAIHAVRIVVVVGEGHANDTITLEGDAFLRALGVGRLQTSNEEGDMGFFAMVEYVE